MEFDTAQFTLRPCVVHSRSLVGSSPIFSFFFGVYYICVFWSASFEERHPDSDRAGGSNGPFLSLEMGMGVAKRRALFNKQKCKRNTSESESEVNETFVVHRWKTEKV